MGRRPGAPVVYLSPDHGDVWQYRFTAHHKRHRGSTGERDRERAEAESLRIYAAALAKKPIPQNKHARRPAASQDLSKLFGAFLASLEGKKSDGYLKKMKSHFRSHFGHRWHNLSEIIQPGAIDSYASDRLAGDAPATEFNPRRPRPAAAATVTVHKELVSLRRFLKWALKMGHIAELPHVEPVSQNSDYAPPDYSPDDVRALLAELPTRATHPTGHPVQEFFTVQWAQASRPGEIESLRACDVNIRRREMTIRQSEDKARVGRTVSIEPRHALPILTEMLKEERLPDSLLFGAHDYRVSLEAAAERCKLPRPTRHNLRHYRLTELGHLPGTSPAALQFLAGHKHMATTDRYIRSRTKATRDLFESAAGIVTRSVSKKETPRRKPLPDSATAKTASRRRTKER